MRIQQAVNLLLLCTIAAAVVVVVVVVIVAVETVLSIDDRRTPRLRQRRQATLVVARHRPLRCK
jgi:hypothetical protein